MQTSTSVASPAASPPANSWQSSFFAFASDVKFSNQFQIATLNGWYQDDNYQYCTWTGVYCEAGELIGLMLSGYGISGGTERSSKMSPRLKTAQNALHARLAPQSLHMSLFM